MDNEITKMQWAKAYMDYLANGVDTVFNTDVNIDTLHNEQVISCFKYISDILARDINESEKSMKSNNELYITDEQIAQLKTYSYRCKVSELANEINRVTEENGSKKIAATWINDWLEAEGYLCYSDLKSRVVTEKGKQLGISSEYRQRDNGDEYYINFYTEQAQSFVFQHTNDIMAYRNSKTPQNEINIQSLEFQSDISIKEYIRSQQNKCFIMSIGSCDSVAGIGSYIAVLHYNGKSKVLKKTNIPTNSSNKCILAGIIDAASAIKTSTDVIILSSTPLGFNSPKSINYKLCVELYRILSDKNCNVYSAICKGRGYELNNYIKSIK